MAVQPVVWLESWQRCGNAAPAPGVWVSAPCRGPQPRATEKRGLCDIEWWESGDSVYLGGRDHTILGKEPLLCDKPVWEAYPNLWEGPLEGLTSTPRSESEGLFILWKNT